MTEYTVQKGRLSAAVQQFVLCWGDMGGQWGVNRSVSQIHALLYLSERPLTADDIADALVMARSNVSNSIKELQSWGLIRRVPVMGDRRDYFEAEVDVWTIAARIVAGRKDRELDPAIAALDACMVSAEGDPGIHPVARKRLAEMRAFTGTVSGWYDQMAKVPQSKLMGLIKLGSRIVGLLPSRKEK